LGASPLCGDRAIRSNSSASVPEASGISASIPCAFWLSEASITKLDIRPKNISKEDYRSGEKGLKTRMFPCFSPSFFDFFFAVHFPLFFIIRVCP
jgi:hypothetical protein